MYVYVCVCVCASERERGERALRKSVWGFSVNRARLLFVLSVEPARGVRQFKHADTGGVIRLVSQPTGGRSTERG